MTNEKATICLLLIGFIGCTTGCGWKVPSSQKVTKFPNGITRVDTVQAGQKTNSQWYYRNRQLAFETAWTSNGDGFEYAFHPNGSLKEKITIKNNVRHGSSWVYREDGSLSSIDKYHEGTQLNRDLGSTVEAPLR